jgi:hypothetical protein
MELLSFLSFTTEWTRLAIFRRALESSLETWVVELDSRLVAYIQLQFDAASPVISGERPAEIQRF